jgi:Fibronectin type III domain
VLAPPGAPAITETAVGDGWAIVAWNAPADTGSFPIRSYTVVTTDARTQTPFGTPVSVFGDATRANVRGLTNGVPYTFTVTATSDAGTGPASQPSGIATPTAKKVSFVTTWTATENTRLVNAAKKLHRTPARLQQDGVFWLADQLRAHPLPGPTPVAPPSMVGPASYDTTWFASDQDSLLIVARQYALTPRETQKYATLRYLDSLSL